MLSVGFLRVAAIVAMALLAAGCGGGDEEVDSNDVHGVDSAAAQGAGGRPVYHAIAAREPEKEDTIRIQGDDEQMTFRLVDDDLLPFSTYVPEGFIQGGHINTEQAYGTQMFANFNSNLNKDAYLHILLPAEGTGIDQLRRELIDDSTSLMKLNDWKPLSDDADAAESCAWAVESRSFVTFKEGEKYQGFLCIGTHNQAPFYVVAHYPSSYTGLFVPRVQKILEDLQWDDTGKGLELETTAKK